MIKKLTEIQEKQKDVYFKKWESIGYRTQSISKDKATAAVYFLYETILKKTKPKYLIFLDSPMACQLAYNLIKGTKLDSKQLDSQLYSQLYSQLGSQLDSQLRSQLDSQLDSQLRSQLDSQLRSQLDSQLRSQLDSQLDSQLKETKLQYADWTINNWFWNGYYCLYDFILNELFPENKKDFKLFEEFVLHYKELHFTYMFEDICFVSDFPKTISLDNSKRLHAERSYALSYRDSYGLCSFNGVRMPDSIGLKAAHEINKEEVLALTNTEQRAAAMRYVGLANFMEALNAVELDKHQDYRLFHLTVENTKIGPYLYMKCPSTGREFLEGVGDSAKYETIDPSIKTCQNALKWRAQRASKNLMTKYNMEWKFRA